MEKERSGGCYHDWNCVTINESAVTIGESVVTISALAVTMPDSAVTTALMVTNGNIVSKIMFLATKQP